MKFWHILFVFITLFLSTTDATAKGGYPYITPEQKAYMKAFREIPKETIHPLRQLGMLTGCNGDWMTYNHSGTQSNGIPDPLLEDAVCGLMDILPATYKESFMVFDYGMYPPLTFMDRGAAHDNAFECMKNKVETVHNPPYYLLMGKQINPEDRTVQFKVALKLPSDNEFADMNSTLAASFEGGVLGAIEANHTGNLELLVADEIAGINKLKELLEALFTGGYSGELTTAMLDLNGFEELAIDPTYPLNWRKIATPGSPSGNIRDYAQREVYYDTGGGYVPVGGQAAAALTSLSALFTGAIILTDNTNYVAGTGASNKFEEANTDYESRTEELMVWLHYFEPADTSQPNQLFIKYKVNISQQQAENKVNDLFEDFKAGNFSALTGGGSEDKSKTSNEKNLDCGNFECTSFTKWRAYCCLRSYIEGGQINAASLISLGLNPSAATDETAKYLAALGCGAVDGVLEILAFVGEVTSFIDEALENTPGTFSWFSSLFEKAWEKGSFKEAFQIKLEEDKAFWGGVYDKFVQFATFLKDLTWSSIEAFFVAIWDQLKLWAGNITGQNGAFEAGYEMGRFVFDMIFDYLTFGSKKFVDMGKDALGTLIKLMDGSGANMKKYMDKAWNSKYVSDTQKALCKIGIGGCFVKGTPVLMAGMVAVPIENVQLLDWALANTKVNSNHGLTASANPDFMDHTGFDPYTSEQQRQRDQYELNNEDWYEVSFQELVGDSKCKFAFHKDWMAKQGIEEVGSIHELNLPEQGIQGPNIITSIKHILPQKKPADEDPEDDYEYRPVTGIFVHSSDDVWTLYFDNGDSLGVTGNHPVFSATYNEWRMAGELQYGEEVLTKIRNASFVSKERQPVVLEVHNLEVKDLHNFLVNAAGLVVHNTANCFDGVKLLLKKYNITHFEVSGKSGAVRVGDDIVLLDGRKVPISKKEFPDFAEYTLKSNSGTPCAPEFPNLQGNRGRKFDNNLANEWLQKSGILDEYDSYWINSSHGSPIKLTKNGEHTYYTWHHHENGKTMMLVEQDVHSKVNHVGGAAIIANEVPTLLEGFDKIFLDPVF